jgi:hypothetical protein
MPPTRWNEDTLPSSQHHALPHRLGFTCTWVIRQQMRIPHPMPQPTPRLHLGWRERTQDLGACTGSVQSCRCTPGAHAPRGSAAPAPRAANARLSRAPATAVGLRSQPTARKPRSAAAYNTVPEPQHGSSSAGGRAAGPLPPLPPLPCGPRGGAAVQCSGCGAAAVRRGGRGGERRGRVSVRRSGAGAEGRVVVRGGEGDGEARERELRRGREGVGPLRPQRPQLRRAGRRFRAAGRRRIARCRRIARRRVAVSGGASAGVRVG